MSKRSHGEGTIYKDEGRKRWHGQITLPTGKRRSVYGKTQQDVQRKIAALKREVEAGMHGSHEADQTVGEFSASWLASQRHLRRKSYIGYASLIANYLPSIARKGLAKLAPADVQKQYTAMLEAGLANTTVRHYHAMLHVMLESAVMLGLVSRNVTDYVKAPPLGKGKQYPLTQEQLTHLLEAASGERLEALWVVLAATGMREEEILGLQWSQVDIAGSRLHVRMTLHRYEGEYTLEIPKSDASKRTLPLSAAARQALIAHGERQGAERAAAGKAWEASWDLVFCSKLGTPFSPDMLRYWFHQLVRRAELPRQTRVHDLRHTFATLLLERGVNIKVVSELLGHSSIGITLAIYGHVTQKMYDQAIGHIEAMIPLRDALNHQTSDGSPEN
jgi:integrase